MSDVLKELGGSMSNGDTGLDCGGKQCGYGAFDGELGCMPGGNYFYAGLLRANESNFHDSALVEATRRINDILAPLEKEAGNRKLAFLHTPFGTMLAWIRHDLEIPPYAVNQDSPKEDHIKALGLIDPPEREPDEKGV